MQLEWTVWRESAVWQSLSLRLKPSVTQHKELQDCMMDSYDLPCITVLLTHTHTHTHTHLWMVNGYVSVLCDKNIPEKYQCLTLFLSTCLALSVCVCVCVCVSVSNQVTFIYKALFTIQIVSKQLYNRKITQQSLFPEENSVTVQLKQVQWWFIFVLKKLLI